MKRLVTLTAALITLASLTEAVAADEIQPTKEEMMAIQMELAKPGPEHKLLEKMAGEWNVTSEIWMTPGAESIAYETSGSSEMVLGGRFLRSSMNGSFGGMHVESFGYIGFDRRQKVYTTVGFDNMGTYWVTAKGTYDESARTLTLYGEDEDPVAGIVQKYNFVYRFDSDDKFTMWVEFLNPEMTGGAEKFKMMEMVYTRK